MRVGRLLSVVYSNQQKHQRKQNLVKMKQQQGFQQN